MTYWYNAVNKVEIYCFAENILYLVGRRCCPNLAKDT